MFHPGNTLSASGTRQLPRDGNATLMDSLNALWRLKWWAAAGGGVALVLAVAFVAIVPPRYEATAQLYINPQDLRILDNGLSPSLMPGDSGAMIVESESRVMDSSSVLQAVVEKLGLAADPEFVGKGNGLAAAIAGIFRPGAADKPDPVQQAVVALSKAVHVVRTDRTYVINVSARSKVRAKAAEIANAVVSVFLAETERHRADQADAASAALSKRLAGLEADLRESEDAVVQYKSAHNIVESDSGSLVENRLNAANAAVSTAEQAIGAADVRLNQLSAMIGNAKLFLSSPEAMNSPDIQRLGADYDAAEVDVRSLQATLGPRHPQLIAAEQRLQAINAAIGQQVQRMLEAAKASKARAIQEHDAAVAEVQRISAEMQGTNAALVGLRQLERQADSRRTLYQEALNRSRQASEQSQVNTLNARIVSQATPPLKRSFPPSLSLLLPAALILGLALGWALGFGYRTLVQGRAREDGLPRLGETTAVPAARPPGRRRTTPTIMAHPLDAEAR